MNGSVLLDTNLLLLFIVGMADPLLVARHKRLSGYSVEDVGLLDAIVEDVGNLVVVPNVVTEVSNLVRQFAGAAKGPAIGLVMAQLRTVIETAEEVYVPSLVGASRTEFPHLGLTDTVLLALLDLDGNERGPTLLTVDEDLFDRASSLGCNVVDYRQLR